MAGIYLHIPFCKSKCNYCDFYSLTTNSEKENYLRALLTEIQLQRNFFVGEIVETIYFGGGTPSLLRAQELEMLLNAICRSFNISPSAEITIEANPDDLNGDFIKEIKKLQFNRLSIGIQSFNDADLLLLNRRHNARQAVECVQNCFNAGFSNISIDLIYGLPNSTFEKWKKNLLTAFALPVVHLSAYHLTYEDNTKITKMLKDGTISEISEKQSISQFNLLIEIAKNFGFEHYEISNFARKNFYSKHNSNYWLQKKYLGLGASAHSYNREKRFWNVACVNTYVSQLLQNMLACESETLTETDKLNDYLITSLRTSWGVNLDFISKTFGSNTYNELLLKVEKYIKTNDVKIIDNCLTLNDKGKFVSDSILTHIIF